MKKFVMSIKRTAYAIREIEVEAENEEQARELAFEQAGSMDFSAHDAEYSVEDIKSVENGKLTRVKVVVVCKESDGAPAFHTVDLEVPEADYQAGKHYELAIENAEYNGYDGPMIAFDQNDFAAKQMGEVLAWL